MGLVVEFAPRLTGKEYVMPLQRQKVEPKEVPLMIRGTPMMRGEVVDLVRTAFAPFTLEAKQATVDLFRKAQKTPHRSRARTSDPLDRPEYRRVFLSIDTPFCPLGFCAAKDGFDTVAAVCCSVDVVKAIDPSDSPKGFRSALQSFVGAWDHGEIPFDVFEEALS